MTTYKALQVTESGEVFYMPECPHIQDYECDEGALDCHGRTAYQEALKQAIRYPVKNKEYGFDYVVVNFPNCKSYYEENSTFFTIKPGIYPYNGEVNYEYFVEDPYTDTGWVIISEELYNSILNNPENAKTVFNGERKLYKVAILVEPNTPEKPDSSSIQQGIEIVRSPAHKQALKELEQLSASNKELVEALNDVLKYDYEHLLDHGVSAITAHLSSRLRKLIK